MDLVDGISRCGICFWRSCIYYCIYYMNFRGTCDMNFKGTLIADLKISPYVRVYIKILSWKFRILKVCEMFVYKHTETIEYVKKLAYCLRKIQTLRVNNSRILMIKKFSGYYFHINLNILGDFQICISVPLNILCLNNMSFR